MSLNNMTMTIADGTISFQHPHPPKGAHKTYSPWLDRKLEKVEPIELSPSTYFELVGAIFDRTGRIVFRERRSDNRHVAQVGDLVFAPRRKKSEIEGNTGE